MGKGGGTGGKGGHHGGGHHGRGHRGGGRPGGYRGYGSYGGYTAAHPTGAGRWVDHNDLPSKAAMKWERRVNYETGYRTVVYFELFCYLVLTVISVLYIWYYKKFHNNYGGQECSRSKFVISMTQPLWMYVTGIVGVPAFGVALVLCIIDLFTPYVTDTIYGACAKCENTGLVLLGVMFPSFVWFLTGIAYLRSTDPSCQRSIYYLCLYSYIWCVVSFIKMRCLMCAYDDNERERKATNKKKKSDSREPLLPTNSPPQSQQSTTTTDHTKVWRLMRESHDCHRVSSEGNLSVVHQFKKGDIVKVISEKDGWVKVTEPAELNGCTLYLSNCWEQWIGEQALAVPASSFQSDTEATTPIDTDYDDEAALLRRFEDEIMATDMGRCPSPCSGGNLPPS
eukprot:CAMPEP_0185781384 /NCGR_PEP_ID=MMETSP1174-20130828/102218_1 /TAXON_ID=35687 /ORGANISM="Dictyocha speculum, Strain CCMP1381" /LENGTH=394 /DNA_ID=CAMNT_0028471343 /DNA_START=12 /DNA_END=1196 /DNA_ORIENTATION=+